MRATRGAHGAQGVHHQGEANPAAPHRGTDADLRHMARLRGYPAGQAHAHQPSRIAVPGQQRGLLVKGAAARVINDVGQEPAGASHALILVVDLTIHVPVVGIRQQAGRFGVVAAVPGIDVQPALRGAGGPRRPRLQDTLQKLPFVNL